MTKILKRSLALVLALLIVLSGANLGAANALAAGSAEEIGVAELIAANYALSEAEKALLNSGYLADATIKYVVPDESDNLVSVDTEKELITAKGYVDENNNSWNPTTATVTYGGQEKVVDVSSGEYDYSGDNFGNAFSVRVRYEMYADITVADQEALLAAPGYLKQGYKNLADVAAQSGNLYILEQAMPILVDMRDFGIETSGGGFTLSDDTKAIIDDWNAQIIANGKLDLSKMITDYEAADSKSAYLVENGIQMKEEVAVLIEQVTAMAKMFSTVLQFASYMHGYITEEQEEQLNMIIGICNNIINGLTDVNEDEWYVANHPEILASKGVVLDTLVANLGSTTSVTPVESLLVADTDIQVNLAMWDVTVNVVVEAVNENNEIVVIDKDQVVLTLADGATAEEVLAAVKESGVDSPEGVVDGKYVRGTDEALPDVLASDFEYTIRYSPAIYTVNIEGEVFEHPYGYKFTLPEHEDPTQAYDYYILNTYVAQGTVITVEGDMEIEREIGAAYENGSLFAIIADNAGNDKLTAILTSGALNNDEAVNYRVPTDLEALVELTGNTLTAQTYAASYAGLSWAPYSYVVDGTEYLFEGETEVEIAGDFDKVDVYYRLTLTNYEVEDVTEIIDLAIELVDEAAGQIDVLDRLAGYEGTLVQLDKTKFGALNGVIDVTDGISDDMKAFFKSVISDIINNCLDSNNYLKIYNIVTAYNDPQNGGLAYYYANSEYILNELDVLVGYLNLMLKDDANFTAAEKTAALEIIVGAAGYPEYAEKIQDVQGNLDWVYSNLTVPNAVIDTTSADLDVLADALTMSGDIGGFTAVVPYLVLGPVVKTSEKFVAVTVEVVHNGTTSSNTITITKGGTLDEDNFKALNNWAYEAVNAFDADLYTNDYDNKCAEIRELKINPVNENAKVTITVTAKEFTVKIDGEADQVISADTARKVTLPGHPNAGAGMSYTYTVDGAEYSAGTYTFTVEQVKNLFTNGTYTITREEKNEATEKLVKMVNAMNEEIGYEAVVLVEKNGVYTGIVANIGMNDLMSFVMSLVNSGYSYIGLNNEGLMYLNDDNSLEVSLQTLVNAILNDNDFGTESLIALGENGKVKLVSANLQLGNSSTEILYQDLSFDINLTSVPGQMATVAKYLELVSPYVYFNSNNGILDITLNLPDQVYGAYLMALMATGEVDMTDVNAVKQAIAFEFLYDYFEVVLYRDIDLVTVTNTLKLLGIDRDLSGYNGYYEKAVNIYKDAATVNFADDGAALDLSFGGKSVIDNLLKLLGTSVDDMYLSMIKEYKEGEVIEASAVAELVNVDKTYNAIIIDAQAEGVTNKYACTSSDKDLAEETAGLAGYSVVMLLDDVDTSLTISGTTILDLNGHKVDGSITATGKLFIIDSTKDTYNAGLVTGSVSGNVVVIAGNYNDTGVSAFLKEGYYMDGTTVRNSLYYSVNASTFAAGANRNVSYVLNTDFISGDIPAYKALAIDIAADLLLNYWTAAELNVDEYNVYSVDFEDIVGLLSNGSKVDALITEGLATIDAKGISNIVNMILDDLVDFEAIAEALENGDAVAAYTVSISPWDVEIVHVTENGQNYASLALTNNDANASSYTVSLVVDGEYADELGAIARELSYIVDDETDISVSFVQPKYDAVNNTIIFTDNSCEAVVSVDMSGNSDYATMLGVIIAYGNSNKRAAVADAINNGDTAALKTVIDNTTVAEVFTALKAMSRTVDFASMAATVGVTVDVTSAAELEGVYHVVLCATGKGLEELEITGQNSKFGNLYNEETGYYELSKEDIYRDVEISRGGYTAIIDMEATEITLKVKIFGEAEKFLMGDINIDGKVDFTDLNLLYKIVKNQSLSEIEKDTLSDHVQKIVADVVVDGNIDFTDLNLLYKYVANLNNEAYNGWVPYYIEIPGIVR